MEADRVPDWIIRRLELLKEYFYGNKQKEAITNEKSIKQ